MRFRASSFAVLVAASVSLVALTLPAPAAPEPAGSGTTLPPAPQQHGAAGGPSRQALSADTVTAVVVRSWGGCTDPGNWSPLNANWSSYGSTPIAIDYDNPALCGNAKFTLADLEASGADVVIISDPAGSNLHFTPDQVSAVKTYVEQGHNLIGSYLTFHHNGSVNNVPLAPLFGLVQKNGWRGGGGEQNITPTYTLDRNASGAKPLFRGLPNPYVSSGWPQAQKPGDRHWSSDDLAGAQLVGVNSDQRLGITLYQATAYDAVFIANMPEYGVGVQDQQFLYNAIVYPGM